VPLYRELLDEFFACLETRNVKYRQLFLDRMHVRISDPLEDEPSDLDIQFKIYYQFLKHHFGLKFLPQAEHGFDRVYIRLDEHSSQKHKERLKSFAEGLPGIIKRTDLLFHVSFVESRRHLRLQICDLIMGASGSYGNRMHLKRQPGILRMTSKQKLRRDLAKYIYEKLKSISMAERGSGSFNWFYSTGNDGKAENSLLHKIRIWKFEPTRCLIDEGWINENLDPQGNYLGPKIVSREI